jgi:hypothetical protein
MRSSHVPRTLNIRRLSTLAPGQYHPRVWRPSIPGPGRPTPRDDFAHRKVLTSSLTAARLLIDHLQEIFEVIEPKEGNLGAFGHRMRNLLLLACMEVESQWAGILRENAYQGDLLNTKDYVKLCGPLNLKSYSVGFPMYPELLRISPFKAWDPSSPTQSLPWYHAYNRTKHHREANFEVATLENTLDAVAAVIVMLAAQFGAEALTSASDLVASYSFNDFVNVGSGTAFRPEEIFYVPLAEVNELRDAVVIQPWTPVPYRF